MAMLSMYVLEIMMVVFGLTFLEASHSRTSRMAFSLNKEECDLTVQGAVVLGSGGGGPLHFARKIIAEISNPAIVSPVDSIQDDDWLTMVALVGQPSKVHDHDQPLAKSGEGLDEPDGSKGLKTAVQAMRFISFVKKVQALNFFVNHASVDEVDGGSGHYGALVGKPNVAARNAFKYLQKQCHLRAMDPDDYPRFKSFKKMTHLLTGELGAVNVAVGLYLSSAMNISVADCDGAGRSVPMISQTAYADRFTVSPTVIMSPLDDKTLERIASVTLDFPSGTEEMVQDIARALLSSSDGPFAHGFVGYGTYVVNGAEVKGVPIENSYTIAFEVGKAIKKYTGRKRADEICAVLQNNNRECAVVFQGVVSDMSHQSHLSAHDIGYVTVRGDDSEMQLWYKNEVVLAGPKGQPPDYMAPDSICILPSQGEPFDVSTITQTLQNEVEVFILVIAADARLKNKKIIESFEEIYKLFHDGEKDVYTGHYKPWQNVGSGDLLTGE